MVVLALELVYIVGANLFLNTPLADWAINRKPEKMLVAWRGGWTVVPGIAHLRGVRLRGQQRPVQWLAEFESARVHCDLLSLMTRTFRARSVRGSGLDFRLRRRLEPGEIDESSGDVPPIPGFASRHRDALTDPAPKAKRRSPWAIVIDDIAIDEVETVWLERYRFAGDGQLNGEFAFEIRGPLAVDRARLTLAGDLTAGDEQVARSLDLDVEALIESVVTEENKGAAFLRFLTTTIQLRAPQANLGFLDAYFRNSSWLGLDGTGAVDANVMIERGVLAAGSRIAAEDASFTFDYLDFRAQGDGRLEGRVAAGDDGPEAIIETRLSRFELRGRDAPTPHARGADLTFRISSPTVDLTELEPTFSMALDLPPSEVTDLTFYNSYLPPGAGIEVLEGTATLAGHLELSTENGRGTGRVEFQGEQIRARFWDLDLTGDVTLTTHLANADVESRRFDLSGSRMALDRVSIGDEEDAKGKSWWARFELTEGNMRWANPLEMDVQCTAQVRDSRPIIALVAQKKPLLRWMKPILAVQDLDLAMGVQSDGTTLIVDDLLLTGKGLEVRADLNVVDKIPQGFVFLDRGPLSAGLELADGERDWKLRRPRRWYEEQTGHVVDADEP